MPWLAVAALATLVGPGPSPTLAQGDRPTFGTTVVVPYGLRGLIYYLPPGTDQMPRFGELEPVGVIYTDSLNIPERSFNEGFPGVTDRTEWFAIDYYGRFWIDTPGDYQFALISGGSRIFKPTRNAKLPLGRDGRRGWRARCRRTGRC